ncbi:hypothetical protein GCM10009422_18360 [Brevundimonas kwangchunensis]|uniref:Uncharacterized protein n=1 Tax=Brevundimonas kwangchunensis TaxID=322163 RepID=A0ABN1GXI4_9CAUL
MVPDTIGAGSVTTGIRPPPGLAPPAHAASSDIIAAAIRIFAIRPVIAHP